MTAVCVVGEMRTYNASALKRTLDDLNPIRVDVKKVENFIKHKINTIFSHSDRFYTFENHRLFLI